VEPLLQRLHAVACHHARSQADARDLVQETMLRAWRGFSKADGRTHRAAWLFVILRNVAIDWRREAAFRLQQIPLPVSEITELVAPDLSDPLAAFPSMREAEFCELLDQRLAQAVKALDPHYREVLVLSVAGGLGYREIAEALDCPLGTVMSRMARARRALRDRLSAFATGAMRERA
jgi:RNA polymerase sigma-70 factor (ECF subfamily)